MTNYEKLKSLIEATDKEGISKFLVDYITHYHYEKENLTTLTFSMRNMTKSKLKKNFCLI